MFSASLFTRLGTAIFVILHCLVFYCFCARVLLFLSSCSATFAVVICYFCARVLLFLLWRSVNFALVFCYFCSRVLLFLHMFAFFTAHETPFYRTRNHWNLFHRDRGPFSQNTGRLFTEHETLCYRTCGPLFTEHEDLFNRTRILERF